MTTTAKVLMEDYPAFVDLIHDSGNALFMKGGPGIGKTKGLEAIAKRRAAKYANDGGYGYFECNLGNINVADFQGYLMPRHVTDTDWQGRTITLQQGEMTFPFWLNDKFSGAPAYKFKRGMIVIEEYALGGPDEKKAVQQLVEEKRIGRWYFPDYDIALLGNRDTDRSGATKDYDHAVNRRVEGELVPTLKALLVHGAAAGWSNMTMAFAARNTDLLFASTIPEKQGPWLTPRSLEKLDDIIQTAEEQGRDLQDPLVLTAAAGTVGQGNAGIYMAFVKARSKIPTITAILNDPEGTPVPSEMDVMMFLVFDLASKTTRQNLSTLVKYVDRLPEDFAVTYFYAVTSRDNTMVSTSEFSKFAVKNLPLLTAVASRAK